MSDVQDILELVKELNRDCQGQELLKEFVDYRMGKTKREPRIFDLLAADCDESHSSSSSSQPPVSEIRIVLGDN